MDWIVWIVVIVFVLVALVRSAEEKDRKETNRPRSRTNAHRLPTRTSPRTTPPPRTTPSASLNRQLATDRRSDRREIPFASPGLTGPLFSYGGPAPRGGREHPGGYAVVDVETTGLSPRGGDRVVEIAIARVSPSGQVEDEFATLINPGRRDTGPEFIHGISPSMVAKAPTFEQVAPEVLSRLRGAVVVAHNATFEEAFLASEFARAGVPAIRIPALCTLWLGRETFSTPNHRLGTLARAAGVALIDKHAALGDVRAVAALLPHMLETYGRPVRYKHTAWNGPFHEPALRPRPVTRAVALRKGTDGWMNSIVARLPASTLHVEDASAEVYIDALSEVLEDGKVTREEAERLAALAGAAGMGGQQVFDLNERYLAALREAALEDELLTAGELRDLTRAAKALSVPEFFSELRPTPLPATTRDTGSPTTDGPLSPDAQRQARVERAARALRLQRAGHNRQEIGQELRVSVDTVKRLLRDAKFLENPESDPARLNLARLAHVARAAGATRGAFQQQHGLSEGKADEAWRDAAVLPDVRTPRHGST